MADILIRGMEMPKDICGESSYTDVRIFSDGSVIMIKPTPPYYGKFEAIPIPEGHGRLIDLRELLLKIVEVGHADKQLKLGETIKYSPSKIAEIAEAITTIVPAEGG